MRKINLESRDTIAARATPRGQGGIGIVRVSGPLVPKITKELLGKLPKPRFAKYTFFRDKNGLPLDEGLALYFKAPRSFTGEDLLELHGHGGNVVLDEILERVLELGARLASPGEFSKRAFLNGKIDLTKAEAIADLINATSEQAARSAVRTLQGDFSKRIYELKKILVKLRAEIEAELDFSEEELDLKSRHIQTNKASEILNIIEAIKKASKQSILLNEGITLVLTGSPNVGKSSLMNVLTGQDTAIVTNIPGTTRDVLRADIHIDALPIHLIDTAGLQDSKDAIEQEGIRRAHNEINTADHILYLFDSNHNLRRNIKDTFDSINFIPLTRNITIVINKIDLTSELPRIEKIDDIDCIYISAKNGDGIDLLKQHLKNIAGFSQTESDFSFSARRRHLDALNHAAKSVSKAHNNLVENTDLTLVAEDLRNAQNALSEITGEFLPDNLLDIIFSDFCIGK